MKKFYVIFERCRSLTQSFFGWLLSVLFNFMTDNLTPFPLDEDIEYKKVSVSRVVKIPKRQNSKQLHKSIIDYGYDPNKFNYITLDSDNNIIDGRKRLSILKSIHGNYLKLDIQMVTFNHKKEILLAQKNLLFGFLIMTLIITILTLIIL